MTNSAVVCRHVARAWRRPLRSVLLACTAWSLAACTPDAQPVTVDRDAAAAQVASHPVALRRISIQVPLQGERNRALNQMRTGLAALEADRLDIAADAFDDALRIIEAIYADNEAAARARSVWYAESAKDFKGEPYERAMAYYYRGIVYLMQGDYQNARASFQGGLLQDTFMEEDARMQADFGALAYLSGWAGRCAGFDSGTVAESFREAAARNPALTPPAADQRLLMVFESGSAPLKVQAGSRREVLRYQPGATPPVNYARFRINGDGVATQTADAVQAEDLFFQASTRAGRQVDAINEGKVVYQDTTRTAGTAAVAAGAGLMAASALAGNRNLAGAGAALMLAGLIAQAAAEAMRPEADARQWDNLPGNILVGTARLPSPQRPARGAAAAAATPPVVEAYFDRGGQPMRRELRVRVAGPCAIAWGREISAFQIPDVAPFSPGR